MLAGVCFRKTTEMLKLSHFFLVQLCISLGSVFNVILWQHCAYSLAGLRHNKQSVRDWKRPFFWLKTPFFGQHKLCWLCPAVTLPDLEAQSRTVVIGLATYIVSSQWPTVYLCRLDFCHTWMKREYIILCLVMALGGLLNIYDTNVWNI